MLRCATGTTSSGTTSRTAIQPSSLITAVRVVVFWHSLLLANHKNVTFVQSKLSLFAIDRQLNDGACMCACACVQAKTTLERQTLETGGEHNNMQHSLRIIARVSKTSYGCRNASTLTTCRRCCFYRIDRTILEALHDPCCPGNPIPGNPGTAPNPTPSTKGTPHLASPAVDQAALVIQHCVLQCGCVWSSSVI